MPGVVVDGGEATPTQLRPLRRVRQGVWRSRDGWFRFVSGYVYGGAGSNGVAWHTYVYGMNEAWGDMEPTLRDAVAEVEVYYRHRGYLQS